MQAISSGKPTNAGKGTRVRVYAPASALWLYEGNSRQFNFVGEVLDTEAVTWYPDSKQPGSLGEWYWIENDRIAGWVLSLFGNVQFVEIPPLNPLAQMNGFTHALTDLTAALQTFSQCIQERFTA